MALGFESRRSLLRNAMSDMRDKVAIDVSPLNVCFGKTCMIVEMQISH